MQSLKTRNKLAQKSAFVLGGLCLLVSTILITVSFLANRYLLLQQEAERGRMLAHQSALEVGEVMARGDMIGLEVNLEMLVSLNQLRGARVYDTTERQVGAAGDEVGASFSSEVRAADQSLGRLHIYLGDNRALARQQSVAVLLLLLALLLCAFATVIGSNLVRPVAARISAATSKLQGQMPSPPGDEVAVLEQVIADLPLDLLCGEGPGLSGDLAHLDSAGLLYIRLDRLDSYADMLDEITLRRYLLFLQHLIATAAQPYAGELQVVRRFGVLVSFQGRHSAGSPVLRAASSAWLCRLLATSLQTRVRLKLDLSWCCGLGEADSSRRGDFYPALNCQPVISDMETRVTAQPGAILLTPQAELESEAKQLLKWKAGAGDSSVLSGFARPAQGLLKRQHGLLLQQMLRTCAEYLGPGGEQGHGSGEIPIR